MPIHKGTDIQFAYPSDWQDRSITAFAAPPSPQWKLIPNFVVTRDVAPKEMSAQEYADKTMVELAKRLSGFEIISRKDLLLGTQPSTELTFTWIGNEGVMQQRQLFVIVSGKTYSFVATALREDYDEFSSTFDKMFSSLSFISD